MKQSKKGFTLAELLIVVAIIAVLVAVSIPIFAAKVEKTRATVCQNNREALRHHIVADYLSGDLDSIDSDKLEEYMKKDDAKCPSDSTYYTIGTLDSGFKIKCRYHDDNITPGDEANGINSIISSMKDTITEFLKGSKKTGNTDILKEFFSKEENRGIVKDALVSDVLSEEQAIKLAEKIGKDKDKILTSINNYRGSKDMKLVPYVVGSTGETLVYYTTSNEYDKRFSGNDASYHASTSLVNYNNKWYFYNNTNYNGTSIVQGYGPADFNKCKSADEIQEQLNTSKWVPID